MQCAQPLQDFSWTGLCHSDVFLYWAPYWAVLWTRGSQLFVAWENVRNSQLGCARVSTLCFKTSASPSAIISHISSAFARAGVVHCVNFLSFQNQIRRVPLRPRDLINSSRTWFTATNDASRFARWHSFITGHVNSAFCLCVHSLDLQIISFVKLKIKKTK